MAHSPEKRENNIRRRIQSEQRNRTNSHPILSGVVEVVSYGLEDIEGEGSLAAEQLAEGEVVQDDRLVVKTYRDAKT